MKMFIVISFREVSYPKKKSRSKEIFFWECNYVFFFLEGGCLDVVSDYYLLLSISDVVGGPSKISFKAGAMIFRDACALRCL
jgi:hypothetical protein